MSKKPPPKLKLVEKEPADPLAVPVPFSMHSEAFDRAVRDRADKPVKPKDED